MFDILKRLDRVFFKASPRKPNRSSRLTYAQFECRALLAGITFDSPTGEVTIEGTIDNDVSEVNYTDTDFVTVSLSGFDSQTFAKNDVTLITFRGRLGDDTYTNNTDINSKAYAHDGNDTLIGGGGHDWFQGGSGDDVLIGGARNDSLRGNGGNDTIFGGLQHDRLFGGEGIDGLFGEHGDDYLRGDAGDDMLVGGIGEDRLVGSIGDDTLDGGDDRDVFIGGDGDDVIFGGAGNDYADGGAGNDVIHGGEGADRLYGRDGADELNGGEDWDKLFGGNDADTLRGEAGNDVILGGDGNDTLDGQDGDDTLNGEAGEDLIHGGNGNDQIFGGSDADEINAGSGDDIVFGDQGNDFIYGKAGADILNGNDGQDLIFGGAGDDKIYGRDGDDLIYGDSGNDLIFGDNGNDRLFGSIGNDDLFGGVGNDMLWSGQGSSDFANGQSGADRILTLTDGVANNLGSTDVEIRFSTSFQTWTAKEVVVIDRAFESLQSRTGSVELLKDSASSNPVVYEKVATAGEAGNFMIDGVRTIRVADWNERQESLNSDTISQVIHEIAHTWDTSVEIANAFPATLGEKIKEFNQISDWKSFLTNNEGYIKSGDGLWWYLTDSEFYSEQGKDNPFEDWATMWEAAFADLSPADEARLADKLAVINDFFDGV